MNHIAKRLSDLLPNILPQTDDITWRAHPDDLSIVWGSVESGVNQQPAFPEQCLDIERHLHIGSIHVLVLENDGIKFQAIHITKIKVFPVSSPSLECLLRDRDGCTN